MTVRLAEPEDLPRIVEMGVLFVAESPYHSIGTADPDRIAQLAQGLATSSEGALFVAEVDGRVVGMIGGHVFDHPMLNARFVSEAAWWVDPPHRTGRVGVALLKRLEEWAAQIGATHITMVSPSARVGEFYERLGYVLVESAFVRRV